MSLSSIIIIITLIFGNRVNENHHDTRPSGLMVEFIRDPSGVPILDLLPEFTWIVPAEAEKQTAYRIIVSSSRNEINNNNGNIWDSGKISGDQSVEIECGRLLEQNTGYFWKVMIWDSHGKASEFSDLQEFKTGASVNYLTTPNRIVAELNSPSALLKTPEGYFADFGKDAFGTIVFNTSAQAGDTVTFHLGEKLSEKARIDRNPIGTIRYTKVKAPASALNGNYTLPLPVDVRNTGPAAVHLPDSVGVITPFRYCEVENYAASLVPSDISRRSYHYFFDEESSFFTSSDTILNSVSDICKYSIKATSFAGLYIDGDRERIPYEADAYINQLGHYYSDREYSIARRTNEYFIDHPTWPTEWILHTIPMFYNDLMFTGNTESVRQYYDKLRYKTLTLLAREDGLISSKNITPEIMKALGFSDGTEQIRDIVDWPPAQKDTGWKLATPEGERDGYELVEVNTVVNAFYIHTLKLMSEIARMLNKDDDAVYYSVEAKRTEKSFNEKLLDKTSGIYTDGIGSGHSSLHANMLPLAFGLVPEEYKTKVTAFVKSRGMACSVYGSQYLLEGLYNAGEADYALDLMTSTGDRSWWNMIKSGSTITLEAWDMKYKPNSDWNHAWGAAPANIIPGYLWGIKPVEPGWKKAVIKPQPGILSSGEIKVPTIRGTISASFRKEGKSTLYLITLPGNINCDFITPSGIVKLRPGLNRIKI